MENNRLIMPSFLMSQQTPTNSKYMFKSIRVIKLKGIIAQLEAMTKGTDFKDIIDKNDLVFDKKFRINHQKELSMPLFQLQIQDKYKKWNIIKRFEELIELQNCLKHKYNQMVPTCPKRSSQQIEEKDLELVLLFFQTFMKTISNNLQIIQEKCFKKFIENLVPDQRKKIKIFKQMRLNKKAGGRHNQSNFSKMITYFTSWRHKYFSITSEGFYYTDSDDNFEIKEMIPFNQTFTILYGQVKTGYTYGIIINSSHRILQLDAQNVFSLVLFLYFLKIAQKQNENQDQNQYKSFAKTRQNCQAKYFIDGKDYFSSLYQQILKARKQIFITGWMLSPYFCLIRQFQQNIQEENSPQFLKKIEDSRIDRLFERVAKAGIKINIIIYNAPTMALNIDSQFTQSYLSSLSNNIKVLCHPNYMFIPFLWSHHQKMVIIDQKIAFLGGLDIGYGRMDDKNHRLKDLKQRTWKGVDYCNYRSTDILNPKKFEQSSINRNEMCRMPWHDIGVKIKGLSVLDLTRHFVQYWNYVNFQLNMSERQLLLFTGLHQEDLGLEPSKVSKLKQVSETSHTQNKKHPKTYNPYRSGRRFVQQSQQFDQFNIQQLLKDEKSSQKQNQNKDLKFMSFHLPKHNHIHHESLDVPHIKKLRSSEYIVQDYEEREKAHQQQIQFYSNYMKQNKDEMSDKIKQFKDFFKKMNPKQIFNGDKKKDDQNNEILDLIATELSQKRDSDFDGFEKKQNQKKQTHQILRSASMWGLGLEQLNQEKSIYKAYTELIYNSREFIYIQNQFFISVQNSVSKAIKQRISRAYKKKQKFKVCIVIPFLPGFDGQPQNQSSAVFRIQIHHIYSTICRGSQSILQQLSYIKNLNDYIQIYCLRTHSKLNQKPVTQLIYVHSKLMIIDDEYALIGSANINDRSLLGSRDSQIAVLIKDEDTIEIPIQNNLKREVRRFAHSLRKELYMEHFAITQKQAENYLNQEIWQRIFDNAQKNQKFYRKIFGCYPDDAIESFSDLQLIKSYAKIQKYDQIKDLIIGNACPFQKRFLHKQDLQIRAGQKQYLVPSISFT